MTRDNRRLQGWHREKRKKPKKNARTSSKQIIQKKGIKKKSREEVQPPDLHSR